MISLVASTTDADEFERVVRWLVAHKLQHVAAVWATADPMRIELRLPAVDARFRLFWAEVHQGDSWTVSGHDEGKPTA